MEKKKFIRPLIVLLVVVMAGSIWWYNSTGDTEQSNQLILYGNIDIREASLTFNNSEHIDTLLVQEGDRVQKGQLLATLHNTRMAATVAAAEAGVASRQASLSRLEAGSRPQEIRQVRADLDAVQAKLDDAKASYKRTHDLYKRKVASQQEDDDAKANLDTARALLKVAQESLKLSVEGPRQEDIEEARAVLKAEQAKLLLAQEVLKDASLYAPSDGVIRNRILEPGDMATPQTPVFTLAMVNPVWVRGYVPESSLGKISEGMSAEVSTDSFPGKSYQGWIGYISPTAEFTPKNVETPELRTRLVYQLRVYVCNPQVELRLGMPATIHISLDQPKPLSGHSAVDCTVLEKD